MGLLDAYLEDAFLALEKTNSRCDYGGKVFSLILDNRQEFIIKYLDDKFSNKPYLSSYDDKRNFSFIWQREDAFEVMQIITDIVYKYTKEGKCYDYYKIFFKKSENQQIDEFLLGQIASHYSDSDYLEFLFLLIAGFKPDRKLKFYKAYLDKIQNFNSFEKISLHPTGWSCTGSCVPVFQERVDFLQKINSLCNAVEFLEHRQYIEQKIQNWRERIKYEKNVTLQSCFKLSTE